MACREIGDGGGARQRPEREKGDRGSLQTVEEPEGSKGNGGGGDRRRERWWARKGGRKRWGNGRRRSRRWRGKWGRGGAVMGGRRRRLRGGKKRREGEQGRGIDAMEASVMASPERRATTVLDVDEGEGEEEEAGGGRKEKGRREGSTLAAVASTVGSDDGERAQRRGRERESRGGLGGVELSWPNGGRRRKQRRQRSVLVTGRWNREGQRNGAAVVGLTTTEREWQRGSGDGLCSAETREKMERKRRAGEVGRKARRGKKRRDGERRHSVAETGDGGEGERSALGAVLHRTVACTQVLRAVRGCSRARGPVGPHRCYIH